MTQSQNNLLGIDYGLKKIGLAISLSSLPQPLAVIPNNPKALDKIAQIITKNKIAKIIIGLPEGQLREGIILFARLLSKKTNAPVLFQDETLTTQDAIAISVQLSHSRTKRKRLEDAFAAALVLKSYLETSSQ